MSDPDRRLVAGCLLGSFQGTVAPDWLLDRLRDGLGGVLLFAQNIIDDAQVSGLCATLRLANPAVIIAIDEEGGDVTRLDARCGSDTPCPAAFGFVDEERLTHAAYAALGGRVHRAGIDLTLAPCADINSNPLNPIIGVRSFGETADLVGRHVAAAVAGFRDGGIAVAVKHFPGHGDTSEDTHLGTATVDAPLSTLVERELRPFIDAIRAGADAIMTAHIVAGALDGEPVSLSAPWTRYLRDELGFQGVVVTDALDMDGVAGGRGIEGVADAAVRAFAAGADLLCLGSNFDDAMTSAVLDRVTTAMVAGLIDRTQLERSRERVTALRRDRPTAMPFAPLPGPTGAAVQVAAEAIAIDGVVEPGPYAVLECRPRLSMASFNVAWGIADIVAERGWIVEKVGSRDAIEEACARLLSAAAVAPSLPRVPVVVVVRDAAVHAWQIDAVTACVASRPDTIVAELGWPPRERPDCAAVVVTHGAARVSAQALVDLLTTGTPTKES